LQTAKSEQLDYELAVYALIDKDRNNESGTRLALNRYISKDNKINSIHAASEELGKLYSELQNERHIRGVSPVCR